jgi:hypothetical protein
MLAFVNGDSATSAISHETASMGSSTVLSLTEMGKKTGHWTLTLHPWHLALADAPDAQPYVFPREELMKSVILMEGTRTFVVEKPRKIMFKLTPAGVTALADWIGKSFLAAFYLNRRYKLILPWAFLCVVGSLTMLTPLSRSTVAPHFDTMSFALGLILLAACGFAKWRPHAVLFLVDSIWFSWMAVNLTLTVILGRSKGWLVLVVLLAWVAVTGFKHFFRFRGTKLEPESK